MTKRLSILIIFMTALLVFNCFYSLIEPHSNYNMGGGGPATPTSQWVCEANGIGCHKHGSSSGSGDIGNYTRTTYSDETINASHGHSNR